MQVITDGDPDGDHDDIGNDGDFVGKTYDDDGIPKVENGEAVYSCSEGRSLLGVRERR